MKSLLITSFLISISIYSQEFKDLENYKKVYPYDSISILGEVVNLKDNSIDVHKTIYSYAFMQQKFPNKNFRKDSDGVILTKKGKYKPTVIMNLAMASYHEYKKTKSRQALEIFLPQIEWVKNNFYVYKKNYGFWLFPDKSRSDYNLKPYWNSALTQGFGIGTCMVAYEHTKDEKYLEIAKLALKGFLIPKTYGGFLIKIDGKNWFEEYPTEKPSRVLNGYIFALAGLMNYYDNTGDSLSLKLFNDGVNHLKDLLPDYDIEFNSKYRIFEDKNDMAKDLYHKLHIKQLLWLYYKTETPEFYNKAKKFLEIRRSNFRVAGQSIKRIKNIESNYKKKYLEYLYTNDWGWGAVWTASSKDAYLKINLHEKKLLHGITIYYKNDNSDVLFSNNGKVIKHKLVKEKTHIRKNSKKVYIKTFKFCKPVLSEDITLKFPTANQDCKIKIFELYPFVDMKDETKAVLNKIIRAQDKFKKLSSY